MKKFFGSLFFGVLDALTLVMFPPEEPSNEMKRADVYAACEIAMAAMLSQAEQPPLPEQANRLKVMAAVLESYKYGGCRIIELKNDLFFTIERTIEGMVVELWRDGKGQAHTFLLRQDVKI